MRRDTVRLSAGVALWLLTLILLSGACSHAFKVPAPSGGGAPSWAEAALVGASFAPATSTPDTESLRKLLQTNVYAPAGGNGTYNYTATNITVPANTTAQNSTVTNTTVANTTIANNTANATTNGTAGGNTTLPPPPAGGDSGAAARAVLQSIISTTIVTTVAASSSASSALATVAGQLGHAASAIVGWAVHVTSPAAVQSALSTATASLFLGHLQILAAIGSTVTQGIANQFSQLASSLSFVNFQGALIKGADAAEASGKAALVSDRIELAQRLGKNGLSTLILVPMVLVLFTMLHWAAIKLYSLTRWGKDRGKWPKLLIFPALELIMLQLTLVPMSQTTTLLLVTGGGYVVGGIIALLYIIAAASLIWFVLRSTVLNPELFGLRYSLNLDEDGDKKETKPAAAAAPPVECVIQPADNDGRDADGFLAAARHGKDVQRIADQAVAAADKAVAPGDKDVELVMMRNGGDVVLQSDRALTVDGSAAASLRRRGPSPRLSSSAKGGSFTFRRTHGHWGSMTMIEQEEHRRLYLSQGISLLGVSRTMTLLRIMLVEAAAPLFRRQQRPHGHAAAAAEASAGAVLVPASSATLLLGAPAVGPDGTVQADASCARGCFARFRLQQRSYQTDQDGQLRQVIVISPPQLPAATATTAAPGSAPPPASSPADKLAVLGISNATAVAVEIEDRFGNLYLDYKGSQRGCAIYKGVDTMYRIFYGGLIGLWLGIQVQHGTVSGSALAGVLLLVQVLFASYVTYTQPYVNQWLGLVEAVTLWLEGAVLLVTFVAHINDSSTPPGQQSVQRVQLANTILGLNITLLVVQFINVWLRIAEQFIKVETIVFVLKRPNSLVRLHRGTASALGRLARLLGGCGMGRGLLDVDFDALLLLDMSEYETDVGALPPAVQQAVTGEAAAEVPERTEDDDDYHGGKNTDNGSNGSNGGGGGGALAAGQAPGSPVQHARQEHSRLSRRRKSADPDDVGSAPLPLSPRFLAIQDAAAARPSSPGTGATVAASMDDLLDTLGTGEAQLLTSPLRMQLTSGPSGTQLPARNFGRLRPTVALPWERDNNRGEGGASVAGTGGAGARGADDDDWVAFGDTAQHSVPAAAPPPSVPDSAAGSVADDEDGYSDSGAAAIEWAAAASVSRTFDRPLREVYSRPSPGAPADGGGWDTLRAVVGKVNAQLAAVKEQTEQLRSQVVVIPNKEPPATVAATAAGSSIDEAAAAMPPAAVRATVASPSGALLRPVSSPSSTTHPAVAAPFLAPPAAVALPPLPETHDLAATTVSPLPSPQHDTTAALELAQLPLLPPPPRATSVPRLAAVVRQAHLEDLGESLLGALGRLRHAQENQYSGGAGLDDKASQVKQLLRVTSARELTVFQLFQEVKRERPNVTMQQVWDGLSYLRSRYGTNA